MRFIWKSFSCTSKWKIFKTIPKFSLLGLLKNTKMNNHDLILEDLQQILFYNPTDSPEVKVKALNKQLQRSKSNNN